MVFSFFIAYLLFTGILTFNRTHVWKDSVSVICDAIDKYNYPLAYVNRGVAYENLGQWEKAIADFSRAIEIYPNNTKAYANRDAAYRKLHNKTK